MSGPMITVPAEAFALLFAYCHAPGPRVPQHLRAHPAYPGNRDGRCGHLTKELRPYAETAFALVKAP